MHVCRSIVFFLRTDKRNMANAASATIEMSVVCLLRRLSTADPEEMLHLPKDHLVDVPLSTPVREVAADVFLRALQSGRDIAPAQTLYVVFNGTVVEPAAQHMSLRELRVYAGSNLYITSPYLSYTSSLEHAVLKLPRPKLDGSQFLVHPSEMGYYHIEDVARWLCSARVAGFANYKFDTSKASIGTRGENSTGVKGKIADRIEKMAAVWPILGGAIMQERSCTNFTVEFQSDHSQVRKKLSALHAHFKDKANQWQYPQDLDSDDAEYLLLPEPCTSMKHVERALTVGVRIIVSRISLVGSPLCIATEPSGELSKSRWVEGERDVHAGVSFMLRPGLLEDLSVADPYEIITSAFDIAGLCAKHCEGHESSSSMPGLKSNLMIPQVLILLWAYELKTPFTRDLCCIVKELYGKGLRMGYLCWVRAASGSLSMASRVASTRPSPTCAWVRGVSQLQIVHCLRNS